MMNELVVLEFLAQNILVPNVDEQTEIGDFFENLDRLVVNHKREIERLLSLRKAMLDKMFPQGNENAAFERCVDVVTSLIFKYGPAIKRKWILRDWIKNIQADCFWRSLACKRYQRYFDCMKAIVKNDIT